MAFYMVSTELSLPLFESRAGFEAFKIWVMKSDISSGRWGVIGCAPLGPEPEMEPWFFKQDAISKALSLYSSRVDHATSEVECLKLEKAVVWSAEHVESRLEDHLAGRPNKWVELLSLKA